MCASRCCRPGPLEPEQEANLLCADFPGLGAGRPALPRAALASVGVKQAAFDVATAVTGDLIKLTNSPWAFSIEQTRRALGLDRLLMINDFTALALSLPLLSAPELRKVGGGEGVKRCADRTDRCGHRTGRIGLDSLRRRLDSDPGRRWAYRFQSDGRARGRRAARPARALRPRLDGTDRERTGSGGYLRGAVQARPRGRQGAQARARGGVRV